MKRKLFGERLQEVVHRDSCEVFARWEAELTAVNREERCSELDIHTYLPGDILPKVDTASMSCGLEVRSPFFDRDVVKFAASLPLEYKLCGMNRKRILKAAFADVIPRSLIDRPKRGFGVPVAQWLRSDWKKQAEERLFGEHLCRGGYIDQKELEKIWRCHCGGRGDYSYLLLNLLILTIFLENEEADFRVCRSN